MYSTSKKGPGPRIRVIMGSPPTLSTLRFSMIRSTADLLLHINMGQKDHHGGSDRGEKEDGLEVIIIMVTVTVMMVSITMMVGVMVVAMVMSKENRIKEV